MQPSGVRWCVKAEMIRRGGVEQEKRADPADVDGMARGLRDASSRFPGLQANTDPKQAGAAKEKEYQGTTVGATVGTMARYDKGETRATNCG